jgi:hypothetical protein
VFNTHIAKILCDFVPIIILKPGFFDWMDWMDWMDRMDRMTGWGSLLDPIETNASHRPG